MKTLLIDDERLARRELRSLLEAHPEIEIIGECADAGEAIDAISQLRPELIFLDIQMPGKSGFDLLEVLDWVPKVIFVTAFDEYALKAFEVNALDYLLKPVDPSRLAESITKIKSQESVGEKHASPAEVSNHRISLEDQIFLKDGERCWFVSLRDIRYFESEGNYVRVYFEGNKPLILKSLNNLEERLDERSFFRISRKHIVNLKEIDHIEPWFNGGLQVKLRTGQLLEVSRRQAARFKDLLSL